MPLAPIKNRAKRHESKKARALRRIRTMALVVGALTVVIGGSFAALLWLMKPQPVKPPVATTSAQEKAPDLTSQKFAADVPIGSAVQSITSPITPGSNASVTIRTTERAVCTIKVVRLDPYNKELARVADSGLSDKTADEFGMVTWTWTMPENAVIATWKADMFCQRDSKSTRSVGEIIVQKNAS